MTNPSLFCDGSRHVEPVAAGAWRIDGHGTGTWHRRRVANGTAQVVWRCSGCGYLSPSIPHRIAQTAGQTLDELPLIADYLGDNPPCQVARCDRLDTELNHTYPRALDPVKAEAYPKVYLCRFHHEEWGHDVTPHLNPPRRAA